jgi:hypothetical protein
LAIDTGTERLTYSGTMRSIELLVTFQDDSAL